MHQVRSTHRSFNVPGLGTFNVFKISTGGKHYPGLVRKFAPAAHNSADGSGFMTPLEMATHYSCDLVVNGSGWSSSWVRRGADIRDGVAYGELSNAGSSQDNGAVAYCVDGQLRFYEAALGHTAADMINDGAIHSWSWGPKIIENNAIHNYMASGGWGTTARAVKSGRTVLAQTLDGDLVVYQLYGISEKSGAGVDELASVLVKEGLRIAVVLDGGGSTQSAWGGKIAHASSDSVSRRITDGIGFMAPAANVMRIPAVNLSLRAPYTGGVRCSLVDGRVTIEGIATGVYKLPGSSQLTDPGALPMYIKHARPTGSGRASGGKTVVPVIRGGLLHTSSGYADGANNPDIYMEFDANYGLM